MRTKVWLLALFVLLPALAACGGTTAPPEATPSGAQPATATTVPTVQPTQAPTEQPMQTPTAQPAQGGGTADVSMENIRFQPAQITVKAGTTVVWTNNDPTSHTVTSGTRGDPTGLFDSGNVGPGETFQFTFTDAGTYDYYCKIHPGMDGVVIVEP